MAQRADVIDLGPTGEITVRVFDLLGRDVPALGQIHLHLEADEFGKRVVFSDYAHRRIGSVGMEHMAAHLRK